MDRIIDFNEKKNMAREKDVDKFEEYIYSMYYRFSQGNISLVEFSKEINKYMQENNISQEKLMNIQKKLMERYGVDSDDIESQMKGLGLDSNFFTFNNDEYEKVRKTISFQEKYQGKVTNHAISKYKIKNERNDIEIVLEKENILIKSPGKIDLNDNELNEFLCSYKKTVDNKTLIINLCENCTEYNY